MSIILGLGVVCIINIYKSLGNKPPFDGLQVQEAIVNHILNNQDQKKEYCVRIYTPSVIPHTYNYLFLVNKMKPSSEWVNGTCWFIIEADSYKKRRDVWIETNRPKDKSTVEMKTIKDVEIRYYKINPE